MAQRSIPTKTMMNPTDRCEIQQFSVLLSRYVDQKIGSEEVVNFRKKTILLSEKVHNTSSDDVSVFRTGNTFETSASLLNTNVMLIDNLVTVLLPGQHVPMDSMHKTIIYMTETDCPPGYRVLQLGHLGRRQSSWLINSLVPVGDTTFVNNDISLRMDVYGMNSASENIPRSGHMAKSFDMILCLKCNNWPKEAHGFAIRTRMYSWPNQILVDKIIHEGCELVPLGDKFSSNSVLQWKVTFAGAERRLLYSLNNTQRKVYILLKHLLQEIERELTDAGVEDEILSLSVVKTAAFFAIENSHLNFWQEHNLFFCFWFCYTLLLSWLKSGHCPDFFIQSKNVFGRPVHERNQQNLLGILNDFHQKKWMCLSFVKFFGPSILEQLSSDSVRDELVRAQTAASIEWQRDLGLMECLKTDISLGGSSETKKQLSKAVKFLLKSQTESDEIISYHKISVTLSKLAIETYQSRPDATGNKSRYKRLKKCKHLLLPRAAIGTNLLYMATFHYHLGTYRTSLDICRLVLSNSYFHTSLQSPRQSSRYMDAFCSKGYTLYHKLKSSYTAALELEEHFSLPHLHLEISKCRDGMPIPPRPYAAFLAFMCCHELGDTQGRDEALREMVVVKYDEEHGGHKHWIVHTFLGICYQTLGDNRRAIRSYTDSCNSPAPFQELNPVMERLEAIKRSETG
ncbi:uncharacterized protein LOC132545999 [Ylistrum balloti]|uniref:uncharacterized protein LOC132545999 n=1 Tax=Ylistrum balloti TaxID=509963 RepID=UPI002905F413|nr:uncharacterized protein LOC132545999 [Ylistrum balloti]